MFPNTATKQLQNQLQNQYQLVPTGAPQLQNQLQLQNQHRLVPVGADAAANTMQQLIKGDRSTFMTSDDTVMMKQIQATHTPDGREIDVKPILNIVEDILSHATMTVDGVVAGVHHMENIEDKIHQAGVYSMLEALSYIIDRVSCELAYKSLVGGDGHQTTMSIFNMLSSYGWEAKLVLTLAAFALNYGEFWLLAQIYSSNHLAKSMAILKQLPSIMENSGPLKPKFDAFNNLIRAILELTRCIAAFKDLPPTYVTNDVPSLTVAANTFPTAVYWAIKGIVACATQITSLTSMGHEYYGSATAEAWELSTLAHKINNIHDHLKKQLQICHQIIDDKRNNEMYEFLHSIFDMTHIDNMKILRALIYAKDDVLPLYDGHAKRRVNLEVLRRKNVLLLISGLDISPDELSILEQIYNESRENRQGMSRMDTLYEVVWVPIVDPLVPWNDPMQQKFETLQSTMTWYTVHHPKIIDQAVIRFIRERWHFRHRPILVVLDPQGRVLSPNAIHMMWIWGSNAFPFTSLREEALWKEETWRLELLVDGIDPIVLNWIGEGKYIILYGGNNIEWIKQFTTTSKSIARSAGIDLEMVYVGKSNKKEQVRRAIEKITNENLSSTWQELMIWFFWTRLESMLFSKIQLGTADDHDPTMREIKKLLSYDREGNWAVLCKGSEVIVNGHGTSMLATVSEYKVWEEHVPLKTFPGAFRDYHQMLHGESHPCCRFEFPSTAGRIPDSMQCPECLQKMEKYITFLCCHDEPTTHALY